MPQASTESRFVDLILSTLGGIGTPPSEWLTPTPVVAEGIPGDAVPDDGRARLYVEHVRTEPVPPEAGTMSHYHRVTVGVWIVAKTVRACCELKSDVLRALFAAEAAFTTSFQQPAWPGEFRHRREFADQGLAVSMQAVFIDVELSHTAP